MVYWYENKMGEKKGKAIAMQTAIHQIEWLSQNMDWSTNKYTCTIDFIEFMS